MKYCSYCGSKIESDEAAFCPNCGAKQTTDSSSFSGSAAESSTGTTLMGEVMGTEAPRSTEGSALVAVVSFLFPIIGLIFWAVWKDSEIGKADSAAKGALASVSLNVPLIGLVLWIYWKNSRPAYAKACGIGALVGVVLTVLSFIFGIAIGMASIFSEAAVATLPYIL